ncbi:MAG: group 1 glycosyl transferase [Parcubacteria group bacterium Athens1014_10]|nr:MAG: group 1 glycosyl transferase [Parcubacteria group bacterium Athens1014_10]TSD05553.1 MAG: group 1 glycosyl transferase [Parcubacteria group bacterium Athens0714_12]
MKTILLIAKTLSLDDGQGRYAHGLIRELSKKYKLIILSGCLEGAEVLDNSNLEIHKIPDLYVLNSFAGPFIYFFKTLKFYFKADFVHILTDLPYYILFSPAVWFKIKPLFITFHGTYGVEHLEKGWKKNILKAACRKAEKIICVSNFTKNEILKRADLKNLMVINNGVDYHKWQIDYKTAKPSQKIILGVGALKSRKGYHISIPAVAKAKEKYPDLKYYIVGNQGDKNYFQKLKNLIKQNQLENNVIFLEKIFDKDLILLYYQTDLFLLTSVNIGSKFEGFGLVYLEAGACGKPVIGAYGCGAEDAIRDNYNGLLVPQNDIEKTAEAILKILDNQNLAEKMGENGRQRAQEMDWSNLIKEYIKTYSSSVFQK